MSNRSPTEREDGRTVPRSVHRMVEMLKHSGPHLRRALYYDADRTEHLYVRDDVGSQLSDHDSDYLITDVRLDAFARSQQEGVYSNGRLHCVIRGFEEAFEVNFILSETTGVVVSFDPAAFSNPGAFIHRCVEVLDGEDADP